MVIADVTATGDDNPLDGRSNDLSYRKEQLRRLQEEVIELEDLKTGVTITDLGLNDFRMDLLNYVKDQWRPVALPNGMHAVLPADPERGLVPGVIFALRNRNEASMSSSSTAFILTTWSMWIWRGRPSCRTPRSSGCSTWFAPSPSHVPSRFRSVPALQPAHPGRPRDGRLLRPAHRRHPLHRADPEEKELDSLFTGQKTTALTGPATGLDDFELIAFLVVEPGGQRYGPMFLYPERARKDRILPKNKIYGNAQPSVPCASASSRRSIKSSGATFSARKT